MSVFFFDRDGRVEITPSLPDLPVRRTPRRGRPRVQIVQVKSKDS